MSAAGAMPTGPTPSLVTTALITVATVFPVLATLAVGLRFYCRRLKSQPLWWDDWTMLFTLVVTWGMSINTFVVAGMAGVNTTNLNVLTAATIFLRGIWIEGFFLGVILATVKISILYLYRRIFVTRSFKIATNIMIIVLALWALSTVLAQLFCSWPISGAWNPAGSNLTYNYSDFSLAVGGMSLVFDLIVLCFPLPVIRTLHMKTQKKVVVAGIFWLGAFCCIAAAVRFRILYESIYGVSNSTDDNRYANITDAFIWAHIEPSASVIAACLPTFGPLVHKRTVDSMARSKSSGFSLRSLRAKMLSPASWGSGAKSSDYSTGDYPSGSGSANGGSYAMKSKDVMAAKVERSERSYETLGSVDVERGTERF